MSTEKARPFGPIEERKKRMELCKTSNKELIRIRISSVINKTQNQWYTVMGKAGLFFFLKVLFPKIIKQLIFLLSDRFAVTCFNKAWEICMQNQGIMEVTSADTDVLLLQCSSKFPLKWKMAEWLKIGIDKLICNQFLSRAYQVVVIKQPF